MSEPAKSEQIEDVLSSIRRLVSDHQTTATRPSAPSAEDGKLVLTPALRVTDPEDPWRPIPARAQPLTSDNHEALTFSAEAAPETFESDHGDENWPETTFSDPARTVAALRLGRGESVGAAADEMSPEAEDAAQWLRSAEGGAGAPDGEAATSGAGELNKRTTEAEADHYVADDHLDPGGSEHSDVAVKHATPPDDGNEWVTDDEVQESGPVEFVNDHSADVVAMDESAATEIDDATPKPEEDPQPWLTTPGAPLFSRRAARDRVVDLGAQLDTPQGDDGLEDVEDLGDADGLFSFSDEDEHMIDEEALRELVADVVRQELQGVLGQRITRNVRKMVRREIRLALAAEGLK